MVAPTISGEQIIISSTGIELSRGKFSELQSLLWNYFLHDVKIHTVLLNMLTL